MQTQSSVFDDLARLMTGAMGMAQGMGDEAKSFMRAQADRFVAEMDLVGRDEFEAVKQLAAEARAEADALRERVAALEAALKARKTERADARHPRAHRGASVRKLSDQIGLASAASHTRRLASSNTPGVF